MIGVIIASNPDILRICATLPGCFSPKEYGDCKKYNGTMN